MKGKKISLNLFVNFSYKLLVFFIYMLLSNKVEIVEYPVCIKKVREEEYRYLVHGFGEAIEIIDCIIRARHNINRRIRSLPVTRYDQNRRRPLRENLFLKRLQEMPRRQFLVDRQRRRTVRYVKRLLHRPCIHCHTHRHRHISLSLSL